MDRSPALAALSALAHETRLDIVRLLVRRGRRGAPAGEIARMVSVSASRLSFHLRLLEQAGLVTATREGRQVIYAFDRARMGALIGYLLSDCCADDPEVRACCSQAAIRLPAEDGAG
ncbi:metalloregulator ArsR/SmtB family transcription factor [Pseudooceanicola sp. 216_PA32_1]|uniref:Metalloregulator ArsR/SmtB family transcription factor n=1 Tax=Pseudooceanicola pacificus TaxID=2676438 RepID=A0A844WBI7_9RHOB|nr:helix-turn-helix domain-containing protein [Pseudooceanicola pacificus]MWB78533.1 metalloregulator ArsR/SmtB family transcription factor [Pseudooceanicola pacificus]